MTGCPFKLQRDMICTLTVKKIYYAKCLYHHIIHYTLRKFAILCVETFIAINEEKNPRRGQID